MCRGCKRTSTGGGGKENASTEQGSTERFHTLMIGQYPNPAFGNKYNKY